ncbi:vitellin-degrading protease-like [Oratosquilla oratoria]|uniref:vitellin-degrading protease-like n=1 Tax=Oratosquilla oratoria TaxID=337810 RepID=UPI003F75E7EB
MKLLLYYVVLMAIRASARQQTINGAAEYKNNEVHSFSTNETVVPTLGMRRISLERNLQNFGKRREVRKLKILSSVRKTEKKKIEANSFSEGKQDIKDLCGKDIIVREGDSFTFSDTSLRGRRKSCRFTVKREGAISLSLKCSKFELGSCNKEYLQVRSIGTFCKKDAPTITTDKQKYRIKYRSTKESAKNKTGNVCTVFASKPLVGGSGDRPLCHNCGRSPKEGDSRIVGGKPAQPGHFVWLVYLKIWLYSYCAGSLITEKWILSAGHCMIVEARKITAILGLYDRTKEGVFESGIDKYIVHKDYIPGKVDSENDIALLKLEKSAPLNDYRIGTLCIGDKEDAETGDIVIIAGWGHLSSGGVSPNKLMEVNLKVISDLECAEKYKYQYNTTEKMICTYTPERDACQGDSGAPAVIQTKEGYWVAVGIVSFGRGCAFINYPGVNTRISTYKNWILDNTKQKEC